MRSDSKIPSIENMDLFSKKRARRWDLQIDFPRVSQVFIMAPVKRRSPTDKNIAKICPYLFPIRPQKSDKYIECGFRETVSKSSKASTMSATPKLSVDAINRYLAGDYDSEVILAEEHYQRFREKETKQKVGSFSDTQRKDHNPAQRKVLLDWLFRVKLEYYLSTRTFFLAVHYFDKYIAKETCESAILQLVGSAALLLASKMEEINPLPVAELVWISDNSFSAESLIKTEGEMAKKLNFEMLLVTPLDYLFRFSFIATETVEDCGLPRRDFIRLVTYITLLSTLDYGHYSDHLPSLIVASAVRAALGKSGCKETWNSDLEFYTGYTSEQLGPCLQDQLRYYSRTTSEVNALGEKIAMFEVYALEENGYVACLQPVDRMEI